MVSRNRVRAFVIAAVACAAAMLLTPAVYSADSANEKKIRDELAKPTQIEFNETPLRDAISFFRDLHGINIEPALADAEVSLDTSVTRVLKNVSLARALNIILSEIGLTYAIENDVLLIATPQRVQRVATPQVHDVTGLADEKDREALSKAVELVLDAPANGPDGKPLPLASRMVIFRDKLILRGSQPEHDRTAALLLRLREPPKAAVVDVAPPPDAEKAPRKRREKAEPPPAAGTARE